MTSQKMVVYSEAFAALVKNNAKPVSWRPHTKIQVRDVGDGIDIEYVLHDSVIAALKSTGEVVLDRQGQPTLTTRNRMNDVLRPLGWIIRIGGSTGIWMVLPLPHFRGLAEWREFRDGMIVEPLKGSIVHNTLTSH